MQKGSIPYSCTKAFHNQIRFWGLTPSYAFVGQPETKGVIERFFRTLKEHIVHGRIYQTIDEVRDARSLCRITSWLVVCAEGRGGRGRISAFRSAAILSSSGPVSCACTTDADRMHATTVRIASLFIMGSIRLHEQHRPVRREWAVGEGERG